MNSQPVLHMSNASIFFFNFFVVCCECFFFHSFPFSTRALYKKLTQSCSIAKHFTHRNSALRIRIDLYPWVVIVNVYICANGCRHLYRIFKTFLPIITTLLVLHTLHTISTFNTFIIFNLEILLLYYLM